MTQVNVSSLTLVWVPGWAHRPACWLPVRNLLQIDHKIVTEHWIHWRSATRWQQYPDLVEVALAHLLAQAESGQSGPVVVLAWSAGAIATLDVVGRRWPTHPHLRLVLASGTPRFTRDPNDTGLGAGLTGAWPSRVLQRMREQVVTSPQQVLAAFRSRVWNETGPDQATVDAMDWGASAASLAAGLEYLQRADVHGTTNRIQVASLVLHGAEDRVIPCAAGRFLARTLPYAEWRCFPDAGHALPLSHSEPVARAIRTWSQWPR